VGGASARGCDCDRLWDDECDGEGLWERKGLGRWKCGIGGGEGEGRCSIEKRGRREGVEGGGGEEGWAQRSGSEGRDRTRPRAEEPACRSWPRKPGDPPSFPRATGARQMLPEPAITRCQKDVEWPGQGDVSSGARPVIGRSELRQVRTAAASVGGGEWQTARGKGRTARKESGDCRLPSKRLLQARAWGNLVAGRSYGGGERGSGSSATSGWVGRPSRRNGPGGSRLRLLTPPAARQPDRRSVWPMHSQSSDTFAAVRLVTRAST